MPMNQGSPKKGIWLSNFVEQLAGIVDSSKARVQPEELVEDKVGREERTGDEEMGMDGFQRSESLAFVHKFQQRVIHFMAPNGRKKFLLVTVT